MRIASALLLQKHVPGYECKAREAEQANGWEMEGNERLENDADCNSLQGIECWSG